MNNVSFAQLNLNPLIFKALSACGYTEPTSIQKQSIPDILEGKDLIASAQTGTGKTAAFVLPTLHRLSLNKSGHKARALILTPTRELADQIMRATSKYGKFLRLRTVSLIGGMPYHQQLRNLSGNVDIIVATPGRLIDHIENHKLDLSHIETLILDEADRMLDMGFIDDIKKIAQQTPHQRQTLLFSATVDDRVSQISAKLLKNPVRISAASNKVTADHIKSELYVVDNLQHKLRLFLHLLKEQHIYKAIIFSATKMHTEKLAKQLREEGYSATAMHGDMKQNARNRTIEQLRNNKVQFLVATDVAARGIDITDISHVINFDLPKTSEDYVHRIGRTGRAGKSGHAISFALSSEARQVKSIERYIKQTFEIISIPGFEPNKNLHADAPPAGKNKRFSSKPGNNRSRPRYGDRSQRDSDDRPRRAHSDRPQRAGDDRPRRASGDRPQRAGDDRPRRASGDRPQRAGDDRPRRASGDRPQRAGDDRPRRASGDRPQRAGDDRPRRASGDRPQRAGDDRPRRAHGDRPSRAGGSEGRGRERSFDSASARPKKKR